MKKTACLNKKAKVQPVGTEDELKQLFWPLPYQQFIHEQTVAKLKK